MKVTRLQKQVIGSYLFNLNKCQKLKAHILSFDKPTPQQPVLVIESDCLARGNAPFWLK